MRQTHSLANSRHKPAQALAALKNKLRKYIKRERRKPLPEGSDYWALDCRVGLTEEAAVDVHEAELIKQVDAVISGGSDEVYVEILARPESRQKRSGKGD